MNAKTTSIVAYITWIGLLIAIIAGDREGARFHINQALVIWIAGLVGIVLNIIPFVGMIWSIFCLVCAIMGLISAINGEEKEIPLLGKIHLLK